MGLVALRHVRSSRPGMEPMSPALAGGFLSTVPPGKSWADYYFNFHLLCPHPVALGHHCLLPWSVKTAHKSWAGVHGGTIRAEHSPCWGNWENHWPLTGLLHLSSISPPSYARSLGRPPLPNAASPWGLKFKP